MQGTIDNLSGPAIHCIRRLCLIGQSVNIAIICVRVCLQSASVALGGSRALRPSVQVLKVILISEAQARFKQNKADGVC